MAMMMVLNELSTVEENEGDQRNPVDVSLSLAHDLKNFAVLRTQDIITYDDVEFKNLLLPDFILHGLQAANFQRPSPIQLRSIPLLRLGLDLIVQSKAGTGKTLVITLAALETVQLQKKRLQVLVVAPTREIAIQTKHVICVISADVKVRTEVFIGGTSVKEDKKNSLGCQIAIGTPGRLNSLIENGDLSLSHVRLFVLDEADKLMEKSIFSQVKAISKVLPSNKQTILCSATFLHPVKDYVMKHMKEPFWVTPEEASRLQPGNLEQQKSASTVLLGVSQFFKEVPNHPQIVRKLKYKLEEILDILSGHQFTQCIIFSNHQTRAESICHQLVSNGWPAMSVRGQDEQSHRTATLNAFKECKSRVLLTTDVMSRGVDFRGVDLVINLDIPYDSSTYLHRMGRAGRFGSFGSVITLASQGEEVENFKKILYDIGAITVFNLPSDLSLIKQESKLFDLFFGSANMSAKECFVMKEMEAQIEEMAKPDFVQEIGISSLREKGFELNDVCENQNDFKHVKERLETGNDEKTSTLKENAGTSYLHVVEENIVNGEIKKSFPKQAFDGNAATFPANNSNCKNQTEMVVKTAITHLSKAFSEFKSADMTAHSLEELEKMCSDWIGSSAKTECDSHTLEKGFTQKDWWTSASVVLTAAKMQLQEIKEKVNRKNLDQESHRSCHAHISTSESSSSTQRGQGLQKNRWKRSNSKSLLGCKKDSRILLQNEASEGTEMSWLWDERSKLFYTWDNVNAFYILYNPSSKSYFTWEPELDRYHKWDHRDQKYRLWDCDSKSFCDADSKVSSANEHLQFHQISNHCYVEEMIGNDHYVSWFGLWNRHLQQVSWQVYQTEYLKCLFRK